MDLTETQKKWSLIPLINLGSYPKCLDKPVPNRYNLHAPSILPLHPDFQSPLPQNYKEGSKNIKTGLSLNNLIAVQESW
jgi:hypothetical protein